MMAGMAAVVFLMTFAGFLPFVDGRKVSLASVHLRLYNRPLTFFNGRFLGLLPIDVVSVCYRLWFYKHVFRGFICILVSNVGLFTSDDRDAAWFNFHALVLLGDELRFGYNVSRNIYDLVGILARPLRLEGAICGSVLDLLLLGLIFSVVRRIIRIECFFYICICLTFSSYRVSLVCQ